jgi:hypothetical protein
LSSISVLAIPKTNQSRKEHVDFESSRTSENLLGLPLALAIGGYDFHQELIMIFLNELFDLMQNLDFFFHLSSSFGLGAVSTAAPQ